MQQHGQISNHVTWKEPDKNDYILYYFYKRQCDFSRNAQIADKTLFLSVSRRVFLEEMSIWIGELRKADGPPQCGRASFNPLRAQREQKGRGRANLCSLHELRPIFSWPWILGLLVLRLSHTDQVFHLQPPDSQVFRLRLNYITGFLVLQLADSSLCDLLAWASSYNKSPLYILYITYIYTYLSYWFFFSRELWLIQLQ